MGDTPTTGTEGPVDAAARERRRARLRAVRRRRRIAAGVLAGAVLLALLGLTVRTGAIPPGVRIAGVDVGGMSTAEARAALEPVAADRRRRIVAFSSTGAPGLTMRVPGTLLTAGAKVDEAIEDARTSRGRFGRLLARAGIGGTKEIALHYAVNANAIDAIVDRASGDLSTEPVSARVEVAEGQVVVVPGKEGRAVDRSRLVALVSTLPDAVDVPVRVAKPDISDAAAEEARSLGDRIRAAERTVAYEGRTAPLTGRDQAAALRFVPVGQRLRVRLDGAVLRRVLVGPLGIAERPPRNARFELGDARATLVPARDGRALDTRALSDAIVANPDGTALTATIRVNPPKFTTARAQALKIREKVSEFTTPFDCCQDRVVNIQRAAAILDGTIVQPGARFSLNDALGERTAERGFREAPTIIGDELKPSVGGGVSQVATTIYNAAFFAGMEIVAHTPHSLYISRYPAGREATVSWPTPDLVFRNDWDAAVLMSVRAGGNAITVRLYSSKLGRRVESVTGERTNPVEPEKIERRNDELEPGTRKVVQSGGVPGFSISYTRRVWRGDELRRDERYRWTYRPEDTIIELGPPLPEPTTPTTTTGDGTPDGTPTTTAPATTGTTTAP